MNIQVDTHTHTMLSGHAHSTLLENATYAARAGLKGMVVSEHGPMITNAPPEFSISTYALIPDYIEGVRVYRGIEANIYSYEGDVDIKESNLKKLDFVIASMHDIVIHPGTAQQNAAAMIGALKNPYVDMIGHPGNPYYPLDREAVVRAAKDQDKLLEINNRSFLIRKGSADGCLELIKLCAKMGVRMCISSDAHSCFELGRADYAYDAIVHCDFPEELIVNRTKESFEAYLKERRKRLNP